MTLATRAGLVIALVGLVAGPAAGDPRPMSAGAQPAPTQNSKIALAREDLTIRVAERKALVSARLHLRNDGPAARLLVGFPCERGVDPGVAALDCRTKIAVKVDGKKVRAKRKGHHWVWPMRLGAGVETDLEVAYAAPLRNDRYKIPVLGMGILHYRLTTGAAWAGPIGELSIRVELPTEAILHIAPAGYKRSSGVIEWTLKDVEPADDVAILVDPYLTSRFVRARESKAELARLAKEITGRKERLVKQASMLHRAMGSSLGLRPPSTEAIERTVAESIRIIESLAR